MISQNKYHLNFKDAYLLLTELRRDSFLKTELDVLYDDFVRWEKNDLLWVKDNIETHAQRKYNYIEYTWVKIVEQLRVYGFSYEKIAEYRPFLSQVIDSELFHETFEIKKEEIINVLGKNQVDEFSKNRAQINISEVIHISMFELLIINAIAYNDLVSLLFYSDMPGFCFPLSGEVYKEMEKDPDNSEMTNLLEKSHVSISLSEIIKRFVKDDIPKNSKSNKFSSILSEKEHNVLKIIRKDYKGLKSVTIKTKDNELHKIEVTTTKKAKAESRLIQSFKKDDYVSIRVEAVDGKITYYENTQKYKL
nr:hypothetical protein [uncultured Psychroserpens sp.]